MVAPGSHTCVSVKGVSAALSSLDQIFAFIGVSYGACSGIMRGVPVEEICIFAQGVFAVTKSQLRLDFSVRHLKGLLATLGQMSSSNRDRSAPYRYPQHTLCKWISFVTSSAHVTEHSAWNVFHVPRATKS